MITPVAATIILMAFLLVFGIAVPILNRVAPKFVSYRWCVVVVVLAVLIGVVIDFGDLANDIRSDIVIGALVIAGGYVFLRTAEKALANGWLRGIRLDVRKGDASASLSSNDGAGRDAKQ